MALYNKQTSLITILSSEHGRLRREQRDIDKRDLQKALKYGTRQRCWGQAWKVEYDGIIFIVDSNLRREITSYPSPLSFAPVEQNDTSEHEKAQKLLKLKPDLCATHTVFVVDNSGSMLTHDINLHRDRQTAAYTMAALEFVAEQLFKGTANNSDVVSLIEFSKTAKVVFCREPVSWVLYNKLLKRRDGNTFLTRQRAKLMDLAVCDSNYLPALDEATSVLSQGYHPHCALSLFFLSDGAPTDAGHLGLTPNAALSQMKSKLRNLSEQYKEQLNIMVVGFGGEYGDFSALRSMAEEVIDARNGCKASFVYCEKMSNAIGEAVTTLVSSVTATRTQLLEGNGLRNKMTLRTVASEKDSFGLPKWRFYRIAEHFVLEPNTKKFICCAELPPGAISKNNHQQASERQASPPRFLAMNTEYLGKGRERLAFRCNLADRERTSSFAFDAMVAKETISVERIDENEKFHHGFLYTQQLANHLAKEFNKRLQALPDYDPLFTPKIVFLPCSILLLEDSGWPGGKRGVLVEKKMDTDRYEWTKWNNNSGAVDGKVAHIALDVDKELEKFHRQQKSEKHVDGLDAIIEGDSDEEDSDSSASEDDVPHHDDPFQHTTLVPSDYIQAFTHFTYLYTNKKVMVCDIQGIFNHDAYPPTFELTDPAIHYASKRRKMVFGRTDLGKKGMQLFFNTHHCTRICRLMQLSKKNKNWQKQWHGASTYY